MVSREETWETYCGNSETSLCYCCRITTLVRSDSKNWHVGHILGDRYDGARSIYNVRPLCFDCNNKSRPYLTTYGYMAYIGTLTKQEADIIETQHLEMIRNCIGKHAKRVFHCIARLETGKRCTNNKVGLTTCCKKHGKEEAKYVRMYIEQNRIVESTEKHELLLRQYYLEDL